MDVMSRSGYYATLSGACASASSVFGKLFGLPAIEDILLARVVCFILMFACNAGVWTLYVKALQASSSSLTATVISAATNYLLSAVSGFLIFGEVTSLLWWAGATLILLGLVLIITDRMKDGEEGIAGVNKLCGVYELK